jgi:hypothetical protein
VVAPLPGTVRAGLPRHSRRQRPARSRPDHAIHDESRLPLESHHCRASPRTHGAVDRAGVVAECPELQAVAIAVAWEPWNTEPSGYAWIAVTVL